MGRAPCCDKANVKKGPWSPEEDTKLKEFIEKYGTGGNWISLPHKAGLKRCGKSCRLRWLNYLRPNIKHGEFSDDEDRIICSLFASIGSRWSIIAAQLPGRTDNDIKNYWNTKLKKKLMGMVPYTQKKLPQPSFPSQTASSPSLSSSSYKGTGTYYTPTKSFTTLEPIPIPLDLLNNNISITALTSLLHTQESLVGPIHHYQGKDSLLMFGGEPSCSSSDGSCNQISYGKEVDYECGGGGGGYCGVNCEQIGSCYYDRIGENQKFMVVGSNGCRGVDGLTAKPSELWGETPLEYGLEEIKQLNSTNACSNLFVDENKTQGRVMYY